MNDIDKVVQEVVDISNGHKNVIFDATLLTSLMTCPRLSDFRFNLHLQSINGKSNSLECGSIVHKFLETYYGCVIQGVRKDDAVGFAFAAAQLYIQGCPHCTDFTPSIITREDGQKETYSKPECGHKPNDFPGVKNTPKESEGYKIGWHYVLDTCDQYIQFYRNDHWVPLEVEVVKSKILYEDDEVRILWKAKLDWIVDTNQGIYPADHKTMKQNRPTVSLNNQFIGQSLIMDTRNVFINKIGFQKTLPPAEKFLRSPVSYTAARLMEWQSEILPYYAKLLLMYAETGYFPPNFSNCESKYGNCAFKGVCESNPDMREEELKLNFMVGPIWNPTNADEMGDE